MKSEMWETVGQLFQTHQLDNSKDQKKKKKKKVTYKSIFIHIKTGKGLPWWRSGWESTCQCRGHRFEPGSGKVPHAAEQLGPCATAAEPVLWSPRATTTEPTCCNYWSSCAWSPCSAMREAAAGRGPRTAMGSGPRSPRPEGACVQQRRPNAAINK